MIGKALLMTMLVATVAPAYRGAPKIAKRAAGIGERCEGRPCIIKVAHCHHDAHQGHRWVCMSAHWPGGPWGQYAVERDRFQAECARSGGVYAGPFQCAHAAEAEE